ncbi:MAG: ribosome-binding factor A [Elusimicrobia bacterium]|nr:ribosome-binding factor A [Elusimicrobiota bacterium]
MFKRIDRLKELFLREVSLALKDVGGLNTHGILTLTGVELSGDGKMMSVYFSVFGSEYDKARSQAILTASIHYVRQTLKKRLRLKVIPAIVFKYDTTPEEAAKLESIFDKIKSESGEKSEESGQK